MSIPETIKLPVVTGYEKLLTETEAIDALGLGDRPNPGGALRWLCRMRRLTYIDVARGIRRFRAADVREFLERQRVEAKR